MKKTLLAIAVCGAMGVVSQSASAAMAANSTLNIDSGSFGMEVAPNFWLTTPVSGNNGIVLGTAQAATGSHSGAPNGSESPNIDMPWSFFGNTGMHQSTAPTGVLTDNGAGNVTLDFSGWDVTWNGIASIPMGSGAHTTSSGAANPNGVALVTCGVDCGDGDTYSLEYSATVPLGDPSGFGGVKYRFDATGTISAVPVPAAVWLFGSGLLGLVGVARRKTKV